MQKLKLSKCLYRKQHLNNKIPYTYYILHPAKYKLTGRYIKLSCSLGVLEPYYFFPWLFVCLGMYLTKMYCFFYKIFSFENRYKKVVSERSGKYRSDMAGCMVNIISKLHPPGCPSALRFFSWASCVSWDVTHEHSPSSEENLLFENRYKKSYRRTPGADMGGWTTSPT